MTRLSETEIRKSVKDRYSKLATGSEDNCCSISEPFYSGVPAEAISISDGSGQPLELIKATRRGHDTRYGEWGRCGRLPSLQAGGS